MPRGPRLDAPGLLHHVMARGIDRQAIFLDDADRDAFLTRLATLAQEKAFCVYAWALIPNHFHLVLRTTRLPLPRAMRRLLTGYAGYFNRRHRRSGHLFQNRYKSIVVEEESYFLELVRYLHLNPLRSRQVHTLKELDAYPYSGHSALMGAVERPWQDTAEVLGRFARGLGEARRRYRRHVEDGIRQGRRPDLMGGGLVRSVGGWDAVRDLRRGREAFVSDERVLGSSGYVEGLLREVESREDKSLLSRRSKVPLERLMGRIEADLKLQAGSLHSRFRGREVSRARALLSYVWMEVLGRSGRALARELRIAPVSVYLAARRGGEASRPWKKAIEKWIQ